MQAVKVERDKLNKDGSHSQIGIVNQGFVQVKH